MTEPGTVVLGVGSPLMGDDGLGVAAVARLRDAVGDMDGVAFLDGGTWGMQLLPAIEEARRLILVDVIRDGALPGALVRLEKHELPRLLSQKISPHQIDLQEVFAVAELRGTFPDQAVALGLEPAVVELRDGLSDTIEAAVPALLAAILTQLAEWGHETPAAVSGGSRA